MRIRERFNPRAPCGARRLLRIAEDGVIDISTHAPLAGRDRSYTIKDVQEFVFQPTRPLRGATMT